MKEFKDLKFKTHSMMPNGIIAREKFKNGYSISVIKSDTSYGGTGGLYEIAVMDKNDHLDYTTPITDDVIGYLTEDEVTSYMLAISELKEIL